MIQINHLVGLLDSNQIYISLDLHFILTISKIYFDIYAQLNLSFLELVLLSPKYEKFVTSLWFHNCTEIYKVLVFFH